MPSEALILAKHLHHNHHAPQWAPRRMKNVRYYPLLLEAVTLPPSWAGAEVDLLMVP
jgi:hypothetical protein